MPGDYRKPNVPPNWFGEDLGSRGSVAFAAAFVRDRGVNPYECTLSRRHGRERQLSSLSSGSRGSASGEAGNHYGAPELPRPASRSCPDNHGLRQDSRGGG